MNARQLGSHLSRDGRIPLWVNLYVESVVRDQTPIGVDHGELTADENHCHPSRFAPFQVRGPTVPVDWVRGTRFWLHDPDVISRRG